MAPVRMGCAARCATMRPRIRRVVGLLLALASIAVATMPNAAAQAKESAAPAGVETVDLGVLKGNWIRPDGGYVISIKSIDAQGQIDAAYFNPNPLPFARAQASRQGGRLRASFELRAGGYNGSTYALTYNPSSDRLEGTYYQAVVKQTFGVTSSRGSDRMRST